MALEAIKTEGGSFRKGIPKKAAQEILKHFFEN